MPKVFGVAGPADEEIQFYDNVVLETLSILLKVDPYCPPKILADRTNDITEAIMKCRLKRFE